MNAHYHDFLCEWRCYFGQQVAPKDTIIKSVRHFRHTLTSTRAWLLSFCLQSELGTTQAPQAENTWCMRQLVYIENCMGIADRKKKV